MYLHLHLQLECSKIHTNGLETAEHSKMQHKQIYSDFYGRCCNMNIFSKAVLKKVKVDFNLPFKATSLLTFKMLLNSRSRNLLWIRWRSCLKLTEDDSVRSVKINPTNIHLYLLSFYISVLQFSLMMQ